MKNILAFETSGPVLSVALGTRDGLVRELHSKIRLKHSENLVFLVDRLMRGVGARRAVPLRWDDIDAFAIDRGPGSFTGLRIGFSFLKGFLAARKKPCYGALSLDMIAARVRPPSENSRLGVLVDARREAVYSRFYFFERGTWVPESKLELLSFAELKERLQDGMFLAGDALARFESRGEVFSPGRGNSDPRLGSQFHFLPESSWRASAATLVNWFQALDSRLSLLKSPTDFLPLYFRVSEAEEKRRTVMSHGN